MFNRKDYVSDKDWSRFLEFSKDLETPNIVINLNKVKKNFLTLKDSFPYARIFWWYVKSLQIGRASCRERV